MHYKKYYWFSGISSRRSRHIHLPLAIRGGARVGREGRFFNVYHVCSFDIIRAKPFQSRIAGSKREYICKQLKSSLQDSRKKLLQNTKRIKNAKKEMKKPLQIDSTMERCSRSVSFNQLEGKLLHRNCNLCSHFLCPLKEQTNHAERAILCTDDHSGAKTIQRCGVSPERESRP